jgi:transposase-like protein
MQQQNLIKLRNHWKSIIDHYNQSNLSPTAYAKEFNVDVHKLYYWRQKFNSIAPTSAKTNQLVKVVTNEPQKKIKDNMLSPEWVAHFLIALNEANK